MSRADRLLGLARSIAIYHALPWRQGPMRRLYAEFVKPGDLVFDIGAHVGNRTRGFAALGCRVVALEPQPDFAKLLRAVFGRRPGVQIVEAAVGAAPGHASLSVSDRTPTVTTVSTGWRDARAREPEFGSVRWNRRIDVEMTTFDALIARFGEPAFVKIDVEGAEPAVLAGLTRAVRALSFEYVPSALTEARACVARLAELGPYRYNWSVGESFRLESASWVSGEDLLAGLELPRARQRSGDVYARLNR